MLAMNFKSNALLMKSARSPSCWRLRTPEPIMTSFFSPTHVAIASPTAFPKRDAALGARQRELHRVDAHRNRERPVAVRPEELERPGEGVIDPHFLAGDDVEVGRDGA